MNFEFKDVTLLIAAFILVIIGMYLKNYVDKLIGFFSVKFKNKKLRDIQLHREHIERISKSDFLILMEYVSSLGVLIRICMLIVVFGWLFVSLRQTTIVWDVLGISINPNILLLVVFFSVGLLPWFSFYQSKIKNVQEAMKLYMKKQDRLPDPI